MKRLWLSLLFCVLLFPAVCLAEASLSLAMDAPVVGFDANAIRVSAPFSGTLTLQVRDALSVYRTITLPVAAGEQTFVWDGLGEHRQRLSDAANLIQATLTAADGTTAEAEISFRNARCRQAIVFALPSSDTLYLNDTASWYAEVRLIRSGSFKVAFYHAEQMDQPIITRTKNSSSSPQTKYIWDGMINGHKAEPGAYVLRFFSDETPDYAIDVSVTVAAGKRPELAVQETGPIVAQRGMSDAEIWALMMKPSVVAKVQATASLSLRSEPGRNRGSVVGQVHGQSQALEVLELRDDGYARVGAWRQEDGAYVEGYVSVSDLKTVQPSSAYGLLVDKQTQTITVYDRGQPLGSMPISSGRTIAVNASRETPAGAYLTLEHITQLQSGSELCSYCIRYDGERLLHQIGYREKTGGQDFSASSALLGFKATKGGLALPQEPCEGLNAYWIWTHIPLGTRIMILDDPDERAMRADILSGQRKDTLPAVHDTSAEGDSTELVITLGGDAVLGTRETWWKNDQSFPAYISQYGLTYPFDALQAIFAKDDMTLINLEGVLKENGQGENKDKAFRFRGLPEYAQILTLSSVEQVNIANNHHIDYGEDGRASTRAALEDKHIAFSGFGYTYVWEIQGVKIGFAGCREATYLTDALVIDRDIATLKRAGCDVIIYSCHWGTEYSAKHNALQEEMAVIAAAAGAHIIVGTHPHVVQGVDTIGNTVVLWSLGNLMFGGTHSAGMKTYDGTLAQLRLRFHEGIYQGCTLTLIPVLTSSQSSESINDFHPIVASGDDQVRILDKIQADSPFTLFEGMYFTAH